MRILICRPNLYLCDELTEYFKACNWESDIASESGAVYQLLSRKSYDLSLYYVSCLDDFAVIRYINFHYPELQVVIASESGFAAGIENVRQGAYTSLKHPNQLSQLQELMKLDFQFPDSAGIVRQAATSSKHISKH